MKSNIMKQIGAVTAMLLFIIAACDTENEYYEVGKQPVHLVYPTNDTCWVLNYQKPDTLYNFAWESKRYYINSNLLFSLERDFSTIKVQKWVGVQRDYKLTTMQIDSIMSGMGVGIGETADLYWTIEVLDTEAGWCDEIRKITLTRCELPANVILLQFPLNLEELNLNKENPNDLVEFSWACQTEVKNFILQISLDGTFEEPLSIECNSATSHSFTHKELDKLLEDKGVDLGENLQIMWRVIGMGDLNNPIENSAERKVVIRRFIREPVEVKLLTPEKDAVIQLEVKQANSPFEFKWECDTTGVSFKIQLFDLELGAEAEFMVGNNNSYTLTQMAFDQLLEEKFEMVSSQKKKMYWKVIPDDPLRAVSLITGEFYVRRFKAESSVAIALLSAPIDGTQYVLNYSKGEEMLANIAWNSSATNLSFAIEYSMDQDMKNSRRKEVGNVRSLDLTHTLLDEMLTDLGGAYLTKTVYWRIISTVSALAAPSSIHSLKLTGMLKPLVDRRIPSEPDVYSVVKIGDDFWLGENLRATCYSDGTSFDTVDLPALVWLNGVTSDVTVAGRYYTWPTALRTWEAGTESETAIIQGVCPDGWHVSTMSEWRAVVEQSGGEMARALKKKDYWNNGNEITNDIGLGVIPGGNWWHGIVTAPENAKRDGKASFWTTTRHGDTTAFAYELFDWSNDITAWYYKCRPWSEGDGTASMAMSIRCVRDK